MPTQIHRGALSKPHSTQQLLLCSPRTPLHLRSAITRNPQSHLLQARTLWWWSRHGSEWTTPDKGLDERIQRHEKIMKYRYSRALRRRRMWEMDEHAGRTAWGVWPGRWMGSRWSEYKSLSSSRPLQADVNDREKSDRKDRRPWDEWEEKWNKDYEAFKKTIDNAIDRDPYGTLFGRHLRSPPSANNSSWTSFSWIFEPKIDVEGPKRAETKSENKEPSEAQSDKGKKCQSDLRAAFSVPPRSPVTIVENNSSVPDVEAEYEYEPISMRRVPKIKTEAPKLSPQNAEQAKPFLSSLFSEHGVDIPAKTYKPHKVYGHVATASVKSEAPRASDAIKPPPKKGFESSRLRELQNLKALTLGTNIETTAVYGGKYEAKDDDKIAPAPTVPERNKDSLAEVEVDAPLFSGTTYQSRSEQILATRQPKNDWLLKEGFRTMEQAMKEEPGDVKKVKVDVTESKEIQSMLQPSLDRMQPKSGEEAPFEKKHLEELPGEKAEDIDLLRASDVRAAARTARRTKQEAEQSKKEARQKLEKDYHLREKEQSEILDVFPDQFRNVTGKLSKSLTNVWKHVRDYPQGIVARTMNSMGLIDENDKKDQEFGSTDKSQSIKSRPPRPIQAFTPSLEVCDAELRSLARTAALRRVFQDMRQKESVKREDGLKLAKELQSVYESQYGHVGVNHRQRDPTVSPTAEVPTCEKTPTISRPFEDEDEDHPAETAAASRYIEGQPGIKPVENKSHPLETATVKPGVELNMVIEYHIHNFEPRFAELVDQLKSVRQNLREVKLHVRAMKSRRPLTYWNATPESPLGPAKQSELPAVDNNVGSPLRLSDPLPTYIFLAYNPATDRVDGSSISSAIFNMLPSVSKPVDLPDVLTSLSRPAKFIPYFEQLQGAGYELLRGGPESLIFKMTKKEEPLPTTATQASTPPVFDAAAPVSPIPSDKSNKIAAEETNAQPDSPLLSTPPVAKEAAVVLDEIPRNVVPAPGPAAPTAPPSSSPSTVTRREIGRAMRRQEALFSGRQRVPSLLSTAVTPETLEESRRVESSAEERKQASVARAEEEKQMYQSWVERRYNRWARFRRSILRVLLTGMAMAGFAYGVGVVAESVGAGAGEERDRRGKRVVMSVGGSGSGSEGEKRTYVGRPGIYSTENSR